MARVLTFSRTFPAYHPKAGQPTYFVEKFYNSLIEQDKPTFNDLNFDLAISDDFGKLGCKHHTIRSGNRWNVGDKFSPRVWSGKPYDSKQIIIAPDVEVKKVWRFNIEVNKDYICVLINDLAFHEENRSLETNHSGMMTLAKNDGLSFQDMRDWFKWGKPFTGQIICWNENINY